MSFLEMCLKGPTKAQIKNLNVRRNVKHLKEKTVLCSIVCDGKNVFLD